MLTSPEPDRNIEELNDNEIYAAIRYLDRDPASAGKESEDMAVRKQNDDRGLAVCVCLYFTLFGCLAFLWLYWR